jgi:2-polyprenyl-6-methoxyphenol hydroxylase-like FAD-dependent oxidoreductase
MTTTETPVLIAGGGPVGLTAALDLAWRGIPVVVVEPRRAEEPPPVKCNHVSSRSMEVFRRLGLAQEIRRAGLPEDYPNDVVFCTTVTGTEFARIPIPSLADRRRGVTSIDSWWPTPEPPYRINQLYLEPIIFRRAAATPGISILNRCAVEDLRQEPGRVVATIRDLDGSTTREVAARWMLGCDGGRSTVRRLVGVKLAGDAEITRNLSTHIRAPDLLARIPRKPSWMSHAINPRRSGNAIAIDGRQDWLVHCRMKDHEKDFDAIDRDEAIRTVLGVGPEFRFELLGKEDWVARRLVAERFRIGRVFLCGDAAHIWIPTAGYGMNAGIADAMDLTWMLAAVEQGWAPPAILDAFEAERHPITEQVSRFAMNLGVDMTQRRNKPPADLDAEGPEGDARRAAFGAELYRMNVQQYCCAGLNFGYFYEASPIIAQDGGEPPPYTMGEYTPSTVPGCRAPHLFLPDGRSLYDALGPGFTLLRKTVGGEALARAAAERGVPLAVLDLPDDAAEAGYDRAFVLVRPDQHVAWRGEAPPEDPGTLIDLLRGARPAQREAA